MAKCHRGLPRRHYQAIGQLCAHRLDPGRVHQISGAYTPLRSNIVEQNRTQFRLGWTRGSDWSRFVRTLLGRRNHLRRRCRRRRCRRPQAIGAASGQNHRRWRCPPPPPAPSSPAGRCHHPARRRQPLRPAATITVARNPCPLAGTRELPVPLRLRPPIGRAPRLCMMYQQLLLVIKSRPMLFTISCFQGSGRKIKDLY